MRTVRTQFNWEDRGFPIRIANKSALLLAILEIPRIRSSQYCTKIYDDKE